MTVCPACSHPATLRFFKNGFPIRTCTNCDLVFTEIQSNLNLNEIYDDSYFNGGQDDGYGDYQSTEPVLKQEFKKLFLKEIQPYIQSEKYTNVLEVGCAFGFFLDVIQPYVKTFGIEVNESSRNHCIKHGHTILGSSVTKGLLNQPNRFDFIVLLDVIEHLENPVETIDILHQVLNPGGRILIVTGNIDGIYPRIAGKYWRLMTPPQHTFFFSKKTLSHLLKQAGFEIKKVTTPYKIVPLSLMMYQFTHRLGLKFKAPNIFNKLGLPVSLFDTMLITAIKNQ